MSTKQLFSHYQPNLLLQAHIAQVERAATFLLTAHSPQTRQHRPETAAVLEALVRGHDLGKGSPAFQAYISRPDAYSGDWRAKEHSALSAALAILWAKEQGWKTLPTLALAQGIAGHHAGFATLDYLENVRLRPDDDDVLNEQWQGLNRAALTQATGLLLPCTIGEFDDGRDWLFNEQEAEEHLNALSIAEAVRFRVWVQFLFSLLLEADKAFLALREEKLKQYLHTSRSVLPVTAVTDYLRRCSATPLDSLRQSARATVLAHLDDTQRCYTLTLPTGVGKTLLAASWALELRQRIAAQVDGIPPKIVIVLPFLSIIDQTEQVYRDVLGLTGTTAHSEQLLTSHSLSQSQYELEGRQLGKAYARFYLDTWRAEVILTTFDQLLLAMFSSKTRHLLRFHQLLDALIILDEVQALPCALWQLVDQGLRALTEEGNSRVLMMSATQPAMLSEARELAGSAEQVAAIFQQFRRYRLVLRPQPEQTLDEFIADIQAQLADEPVARLLVTLNTRAAAKKIWQALLESHGKEKPVYLISADVTPLDRLAKIAAIKDGKPCIVVSTQTVEAGVDIDMDKAIRDFAPLDALIQIAGRCNRNQCRGDYGGVVEVVSLLSRRGRRFADMIYDPILLDATRQVLSGLPVIGEEDVLSLSRAYFALLKERMNTGTAHVQAFAYWRDMPDIRTLLRGEPCRQHTFAVLYGPDGESIRDDIRQALALKDHWERRHALQDLAGEIQKRSVTVYARPDFQPENYANQLGPFWDLHNRYYKSESGLDFGLDEDNPVCIF